MLLLFGSNIGKLNDNFDVLCTSAQGFRKVLRTFPPGYERASQERTARAKASAALYQCRLLAFTLPNTILFFRTAEEPMSAMGMVGTGPPCPTPVRHTTPLAATREFDSEMTSPTPVHSRTMSGANPTSATVDEWYAAPRARTSSGLGPD